DALTSWISKILVMETDLNEIFSAQLDDLAEDSDYHKKVKSYVDNHKKRKELLEKTLDNLDEDSSKFKKVLAQFMGSIKGTLDNFRDDPVLYALVSDLGFLQHAIAFYRVTIVMAQQLEKK